VAKVKGKISLRLGHVQNVDCVYAIRVDVCLRHNQRSTWSSPRLPCLNRVYHDYIL